MAEVQPLRGVRYATTEDLAQVTTPPYDIIDGQAQERYYEWDPHNIIRLELGKTYPNDNNLNNVYTRAAATFSEWRLADVLQQEGQACYYLYQQKFTYDHQSYTRTSLLARVRLEPWEKRVVLPHENTLAKAKEDRLQLLRACSANFSPIMCMYDDPQGRMRRLLSTYAEHAEVHISDDSGVEHLLQPVREPQQIALIQDFFAQRQLYIADGHHRYTTALTYQQEVQAQRKETNPNDGSNFVLMSLIDIDDPGMLVLPTHRLLQDLSPEMLARINVEHLSRYFSVQALAHTEDAQRLQELATAGQQAPSLLIQQANQAFLLSLNADGQQRMAQSGHSTAWNALDVAIAQKLVLEDLLGISSEEISEGKYIRYTHDTEAVFQAIQSGKAQVAIILNATPLRQVCDVAQADDRMPQKSTYLYPKLITGLVINPLW
ncbi:MAG TPA: DUF1015 domain-containing protein [Ktedonobacteraceae bacterium]|nr:DUF1015 domain-containing protein [Ktedonobacteraceae bacterium]